MLLEFIGVGEAFDPELGSSCYLLHAEIKLLIDCGYAALGKLFAKKMNPNAIDALYITHFHADHTFGIPPLLAAWRVQGRKHPFMIIGQPGTRKKVESLMELAYPQTFSKLPYPVHFLETVDPVLFQNIPLSFALTNHSLPNYAVKLKSKGVNIGFSGDSALSEDSKKLFQDCEVLVHEAFGLERAMAGHTTARDVIHFANTLPNLKTLALVHIQREEREKKLTDFLALGKEVAYEVYVPSPGSTLPIRS
jgi:ribonuclease Z